MHVAQIRPASAGTVYNGVTAIVTVSKAEAGLYRLIKVVHVDVNANKVSNLTGSEIKISEHLKVARS